MIETQTLRPDGTESDIYGQYAHDRLLHPDEKFTDDTGTLDARGDGSIGFHHGTHVFDHVDLTPDAATGQAQAQDTAQSEYEALGLNVGTLQKPKTTRVDEAEKWLKENDPEYDAKKWL